MFLSLQSVMKQGISHSDFIPHNHQIHGGEGVAVLSPLLYVKRKNYFCKIVVKDLRLYWTQKSDLLSFSSVWHLINEAWQRTD